MFFFFCKLLDLLLSDEVDIHREAGEISVFLLLQMISFLDFV